MKSQYGSVLGHRELKKWAIATHCNIRNTLQHAATRLHKGVGASAVSHIHGERIEEELWLRRHLVNQTKFKINTVVRRLIDGVDGSKTSETCHVTFFALNVDGSRRTLTWPGDETVIFYIWYQFLAWCTEIKGSMKKCRVFINRTALKDRLH